MNTLALLAALSGISNLLMAFLYALLVIAIIGGLIWAINKYIYPIPPPILAIVAIVLVILIAIWVLDGFPRP